MILDYNRKPDATVDEKVQSLMESTQLALNDIARAQDTADVAKEDAQNSIALSQTARQAANEASESAARAKEAADEATEAVEAIEGDVSGLKTRVTKAESDIDAAEDDISSLQSDVSTAKSNISTIQTNITDLTGRVGDAEDAIDAVEGDIGTLQSDVSQAKTDISNVQTNITNLTDRVGDAETELRTAEDNISNLQTRVSDAEDDVEDVMKGLALAEDVVGTLTWITAHSTVTTDTTPQQGTVYYIKHLDGTFEAVTDTTGKNPAQEGWYVLDEALQNYVLSHLSLQNDGLYVMKDGSHWKVKIGNNGVYILDPNDEPANQMTGSGNIIGYDDETHVEIDYHSLQLKDKDDNAYFYVSDLRSRELDGDAHVSVRYTHTSAPATETMPLYAPITHSSNYSSYTISRSDGYSFTSLTIEPGADRITFSPPLPRGEYINFDYYSDSERCIAFTFGKRTQGRLGLFSAVLGEGIASGFMSYAKGYNVIASGDYSQAEGYETTASGWYSHAESYDTTASGVVSHAEGYHTTASGGASHAEGSETTASGTTSHAEGSKTTASGDDSHAEGYQTTASGGASHAEGYHTTASGRHSHAKNLRTIASRQSQTALGEYNIEDTQGAHGLVRGQYVVIVGNGTSNNARSNALTIDWDGNVEMALDTTAQSGVDKEIYDALVDLGWDSDVIV